MEIVENPSTKQKLSQMVLTLDGEEAALRPAM